MQGAKLQRRVIHLCPIEILHGIPGDRVPQPRLLQERLLRQPILVAAFFPLGDIIGLEVFAVFTQALDDFRVGEAIDQPVVNLVTEVLRKAGNFAVAAVIEQGRRFRGRSLSQIGLNFGVCGHRSEKLLRFSQIYSDLVRCGEGNVKQQVEG